MTHPNSSDQARILLIEDSVADVILLRHGLDSVGHLYDLQVLHDGEAAIKFIQSHWSNSIPTEPCLIVLDLHLPKYDGLTVLKTLRQAPAFSHIKVAVLTYNASPREEQQLQTFEVDLYRRKPRDLADFNRLAKELLEICHSERIAA